MRRIIVLLVIAAALAVSALGFAVTSTAAPHPARTGGPDFVCVSTPYLGFCVGPPTRQG